MTTTGARRGRMETGRLTKREARFAAPRLADARCARCGGPLTLVPFCDGDYYLCGVPDAYGGVDQRCAGIRRADGTVIPPELPDGWGLPF